MEDRPELLPALQTRIERELGGACHCFASIESALPFLSANREGVAAAIVNQRLTHGSYSPFAGLPTVIVSDGLPVEGNLLLKAENVLDYVMDYSPHNHAHVLGLLKRAQFQTQVKILVVDNEPTIRNLFCNLLKKQGFHMLQAKNGKEALELMEENPEVRLVLTDMEMPLMGGAWLIAALRSKFSKQELPIIGLADEREEGTALQFLRIGANDVISKPPRFLHEVQVRVMQNLALAEAFQEIADMGRRDFLTGLYNRRHFFETGEKIFAQLRRGRLKVAVAMLDIDNFKRVNDTWGHGAGDVAISEVARILKANLRDTDVLARFGGEEYCVLLAGLETERDAVMVMKRIVQKISQAPLQFEKVEFQVTVSCGVCLAPKDTLEGMIQESDRQLYQAKADGKNRVVAEQ